MFRILALLVLIPLAALANCSTLNPVTLARLAMLDPLDADPGDFAILLDLPQGLGIPTGGAVLEMVLDNKATGERREGRFVFEQREVGPGTVYRIAPPDLEAMRAFQATARAWKAQYGDEAEGSLSLGLSMCRTGAGPQKDATVSAQLSLDGGATFLPFMRATPVERLAEGVGVARLPTC